MTFGQSISTCFRKYATFSGRASRSEFWWFWLFCIILNYGGVFLDGVLFGQSRVFSLLISLVLLLPQISAGVRRCHDTNHSGWWWLCPIYNIVLALIPSEEEDNEYGPVGE